VTYFIIYASRKDDADRRKRIKYLAGITDVQAHLYHALHHLNHHPGVVDTEVYRLDITGAHWFVPIALDAGNN